MALRLQIISRHRQALGERGSREFGRAGGTIGRSLESDWMLPDSQRYLSSRHASIDYRSGSYYLVDMSTNGVYVNDADHPVGRGNPQRLFTGDRIRIGEYEMSVEIKDEDDTDDQFIDTHVDPVSAAQRVPPPDPTRVDLLPAHEITAVGIEMLISEGTDMATLQIAARTSISNLRLEEDPPPPKHNHSSEPPPSPALKRAEPPLVGAAPRVAAAAPAKPTATPAAPPPAKAPPATATAEPLPTATSRPPAAAAPAKPTATPAAPPAAKAPPATAMAEPRPAATPRPPAAATASTALDAFFRGAGLPTQKLDDQQAEQTLHRLGQLMREVVLGVAENLQIRNDHKNVLRMPTTTIQPRNNNPLKFSASVEEALTNLLFRQSSEYLSAVEAVRETFADIKQHQKSLLGALRTAIVDYVGRLDPDDLENKVTNGKRGPFINAANKLKYWDLYKALYQVVTQQNQPGHFPQLFLEDLARCYEQENARTVPASAAHHPDTKIGS